MGKGVNIPWVGGRYTMDRGVDIPWVRGQNTMGRGCVKLEGGVMVFSFVQNFVFGHYKS